ncbi:hypothetical protein [Rhabdochlamydiaceae symbiont of Dictyostelium giganteum]|uniref:hypothetical protein n=1 Tax=Rhabdochlamydiaceae symbiont of Dictyostelium giganteum TaxID=3342349 RepID=UPI003850EB75
MSLSINELSFIGTEETARSRRWYREPKRLAGSIISAVSFIACGIFQALGRRHPVVATLSSVGIGASLQTGLEVTLSTKALRVLHHIEMKNAFALYFTLTQVYLNLPVGSVEREAILYLITTLGGGWISLKLAAIISRKLGDRASEAPLLSTKYQKEMLLEPDSKLAFISYQVGKGALGGAMMGLSHGGYDYLNTLYNLGIFLIGHLAGVTAEVGLSHLKHRIRKQNQEEIFEGKTPLSLRVLNIAERVIDTFGNHGWGMMISLNHPASYCAIGSLIGFTKMTAKERFMVEGTQKEELNPTFYKVDRVVDVVLGLAVAGWVTAIIIDDKDLFDRIAISSMGGGVTIGYALRFLLNKVQHTESKWKNSLDFYTKEHPVVWILPFSYVWEQLQINDVALASMEVPSLVMAAIGWGSLGSSFGIDRALIDPKISPIVDSLFGNLFVAVAKGEA